MLEPFNFHDSWYLVETNWVWILVALALGIWVGWRSSAPDAG
jgi:hypothetical protein